MSRIKSLPVVVCLAGAMTSISAATFNVQAGDNLQTFLNTAIPGDTIVIQAGAVFRGNFVLPKKQGSLPIVLKSSMENMLPQGRRVTPADARYMPRIETAMDKPAIATAAGTSHWVLSGLEVTHAQGVYTWTTVSIGTGVETNAADIPSAITVDRSYIHGDPVNGGKRGIALNGNSLKITNNWISDYKHANLDAQALMGWGGSGIEITNNHLEGASENIMFGGAKPGIVGLVPSDITIRRNTLRKLLSWRAGDPSYAGKAWNIKNHFELKNAQRVVFDGNILENNWANPFGTGTAITLTPRTENGAMPWATVQDVTITNNIVRNVGEGFRILGRENTSYSRRITIRNNVFEVSKAKWGGTGAFVMGVHPVDTLVIDHNTIMEEWTSMYFAYTAGTGLVYTNNVSTASSSICGDGRGCGVALIVATSTTATGNIGIGQLASMWPAGNWVPALTDVKFANAASGDYALLSSSPFKNKATDGTDPGVDMNKVWAATGGLAPPQSSASVATPVTRPTTGAATFVKADTATTGNWQGVYGADGAYFAGGAIRSASYVSVNAASAGTSTWAASTSDTRAPQKPDSATDRTAACWFSSNSFQIDLSFADDTPRQVALYLLDWNGWGGARSQKVEIIDTNGQVLDARNVTGFGGGLYLVWNLSGRVAVRITNSNPSSNAVASAVLFGSGASANSSSVAFVKTDTTTQGAWRGVYGADGFNVIGGDTKYPSYVTVTPSGHQTHTWAASTAAITAPLKTSAGGERVAGCWHSTSSLTIDLSFSDQNAHQVALYMLDWNQWNGGRAQRFEIVDKTGKVLDTRKLSGFANGQYLVWNLSGDVTIRVINENPLSNAVVSGIFFR